MDRIDQKMLLGESPILGGTNLGPIVDLTQDFADKNGYIDLCWSGIDNGDDGSQDAEVLSIVLYTSQNADMSDRVHVENITDDTLGNWKAGWIALEEPLLRLGLRNTLYRYCQIEAIFAGTDRDAIILHGRLEACK